MKKKNRLFSIDKKFIILNLILLASIVFCLSLVTIMGSEYTTRTRVFRENTELTKVEATYSDDGVVELKDCYLSDDNEIVLEFKTVGKGQTEAHIRCVGKILEGEDKGKEYLTAEINRELRVNALGTIIDETSDHIEYNNSIITVYVLLFDVMITFVIMLWAFFDYRRRGEFSYAMIACGGIGLLTLVLFLFGVYKLLNNAVYGIGDFMIIVVGIGNELMLFLTPVMMILSVLLAVSNIWLMRNEGYRPVNALGIVFAAVWLIGTLFAAGVISLPIFSQEFMQIYFEIKMIVVYIICYFECMFLSTVASAYLATKYKPALDRDYIIILGCAIRSDGSLTPLLRARVDSALAFEREQYEKTGKHAKFVPSGGQGSDEVISEGEAMERYLLGVGVPSGRILREDKSVNTMQNMSFSYDKIKEDAEDPESVKIAFATTNYHVFRGYILSKKNGFEAKGISAKTKPYFYLNAFLREFIGLLVDQKFRHIAYILITVILFRALL